MPKVPLKRRLKGAELRVPQAAGQLVDDRPATAIMIPPSEKPGGMLETLPRDTLRGDRLRVCIDTISRCGEEHRDNDGQCGDR